MHDMNLTRLQIEFKEIMAHGITDEEFKRLGECLRNSGNLQILQLNLNSPSSTLTEEGLTYFVNSISETPLKRFEFAMVKQQGPVLTDKIKQEIKNRFPEATIILL